MGKVTYLHTKLQNDSSISQVINFEIENRLKNPICGDF